MRRLKSLLGLPKRLIAPATSEARRRFHEWLSARIRARVLRLTTETTPALEGLVREIVWLQHRVDQLEAALAERSTEESKAA